VAGRLLFLTPHPPPPTTLAEVVSDQHTQSVRPSVHPSTHRPSMRPSVRLSVRPSIRLSVDRAAHPKGMVLSHRLAVYCSSGHLGISAQSTSGRSVRRRYEGAPTGSRALVAQQDRQPCTSEPTRSRVRAGLPRQSRTTSQTESQMKTRLNF
jgi:hypothetical protein